MEIYFFMIFNLQELHAVQKMEFSLQFWSNPVSGTG